MTDAGPAAAPSQDVENRLRLDQVDEDALHDATGDSDEDARPRLPRGGRRRRPTGEAPPLPAAEWWGGVRWALIAVLLVTASVVSFAILQPDGVLRFDESASRWMVDRRTGPLIEASRMLDALTRPDLVTVLRWATIIVLLAVRRLRHLMVFLMALLLVEWAAQAMNFAIQRPRPMVEIIGSWDGFSHPSQPIAALTVTLLASLRVLAPHGPIRRNGAFVVGALVVLAGTGRVILGLDHISDVVVGAAMAAGTVFALTRLLVSHVRHPVEYRRGQSAHVTLSEDRRGALTKALADQLGLVVTDITLHGEVGSAGSTPLKFTLEDGEGGEGPNAVFAKLYTRQHLFSDRLYKFVRLLMYGRLENETPFASVRQLVQYEDHLTRVLRDNGVSVPASYGIVEITPEQEYLIAFDFAPGEDFHAHVEVSDALIDNCLHLVEQLWTAGIAHRDIKPGNILVDGDTVTLIDVAFAQLRPTPWRQAVDLGAMLLLLSLAADPQRVYRRALETFDAEEIAEALAATEGFAIPSQLRDMLDEDNWAVRDELRGLAPERDPIRIQRWDRRRVVTALATTAGITALVALVWTAFDTVGLL